MVFNPYKQPHHSWAFLQQSDISLCELKNQNSSYTIAALKSSQEAALLCLHIWAKIF